jgi:hypothetical protein
MRKTIAWVPKLLKEARGNAVWDFVKWLFRNAPWVGATVTALVLWIVGWIKRLPLPILIVLALAIGVMAYFVIRGIARHLDSKSVSVAKDEPDQKLQVACGPNIEGSIAQAWWTINGEPVPVNFFRIVVNAAEKSQLIKNCTGFLTRIEKDRKPKWGGNNAQLAFAQAEEPDALSKTIRYPVAEYLDVLAVTDRNEVFPGTKPTIGLRLWPFVPSMDEIFSELGDYLLKVVITGDSVVPPITTLLKFRWTGDWQTAALTLVPSSKPSGNVAFPRVTYEETYQIIGIFTDAPRVKVAITSLSVRAGEEFRTVMEQAGWFCKALQDAGVTAKGQFWETLGSLPDGTNIWWKKTGQNNDMVERIIRAAAIKGLHPTEVQRPVSAGDCEIELMIGRNPT